MQIRYDRIADVLLSLLRDEPPVDAIEEAGGVIVSYGEDGRPLSVEFLQAMARGVTEMGTTNIQLQPHLASAATPSQKGSAPVPG